MFGINFTNAKTKFYICLGYNDGNTCLFVNGNNKINKNINFPL